jgi:hypothetical protein
MLQDNEFVVALWPIVQVSLICIATFFDTVIAPFQTLFEPAAETNQAGLIMSKKKKANVINTMFGQIAKLGWKPMFDNRDGVAGYFREKQRRISEEKKIGIQVCDVLDAGSFVQNIQWQCRRAGKVVLDPRSVLFRLAQPGAVVLELSQRN